MYRVVRCLVKQLFQLTGVIIFADVLLCLRSVSLLNGITRNDSSLDRRLESQMQQSMVALRGRAFESVITDADIAKRPNSDSKMSMIFGKI